MVGVVRLGWWGAGGDVQGQGYRKLAVWQKAHAFLKLVLEVSRHFPSTREAQIVRAQLVRAAISVPANIVEGYGGQCGRSFVRYLKVSRGSAWEADYWILLAEEIGAIDRASYNALRRSCGEVIAMLTAAINKAPQ